MVVRGVNISYPSYPPPRYPFLTYIYISLSNNIHLYVADHICIYLSIYLPILLSIYLLISLSIEIYRYGVVVFPVSYTNWQYTYIRTTYVLRTYATIHVGFIPRPNTHPISPCSYSPILSIPILDN